MADRILIADDEEIIRDSLSFVLRKEGYTVVEAIHGKDAYDKICAEPFDALITDLEMPVMKGIELLQRVSQTSPQTVVVVITAYGSLETAIAALRAGASDYILKPIEFDELLIKVRRLLEHKRLTIENQILRREVQRDYDFSNLIGTSPAMKRVLQTIQTVAASTSTVLISGKSGTGKELVARAIHFNSSRKDRPFIAVNCGAIPETLIESELFGHKRGSFTGAVADKVGYFKAADGGTLFLDEVSEMPLQLQVRLLRAIEQKEILPVGTSLPLAVDVRILASTNRILRKEVETGRFREDLFYRLNVVELQLPTLAERREDIPQLVEYFVTRYRQEMGKNIKGVDNEVMRAFMHHEWRGEVRELENAVERAVIFCSGEFIMLNDLPEIFVSGATHDVSSDPRSFQHAQREFERNFILNCLQQHSFDKEKTAQTIGMSVPTLYRRIKELGIQQP